MTTLARRNNFAATLISSGNRTEAFYELRQAMDDLAQTIKLDEAFQSRPQEEMPFSVSALNSMITQADTCAFDSPFVINGSETESYTVESVSIVCATVLFNMALACQVATTHLSSPMEQEHSLKQSQAFYKQAYGICKNLDLTLLHLALCNNLSELALEDADLDALSHWRDKFDLFMESEDTNLIPPDVFIHFLKVRIYFTPSFQSAWAA